MPISVPKCISFRSLKQTRKNSIINAYLENFKILYNANRVSPKPENSLEVVSSSLECPQECRELISNGYRTSFFNDLYIFFLTFITLILIKTSKLKFRRSLKLRQKKPCGQPDKWLGFRLLHSLHSREMKLSATAILALVDATQNSTALDSDDRGLYSGGKN